MLPEINTNTAGKEITAQDITAFQQYAYLSDEAKAKVNFFVQTLREAQYTP